MDATDFFWITVYLGHEYWRWVILGILVIVHFLNFLFDDDWQYLAKMAAPLFVLQWIYSLYGLNSIALFGTVFVMICVVLEHTYVANEEANRKALHFLGEKLDRIEQKLADNRKYYV